MYTESITGAFESALSFLPLEQEKKTMLQHKSITTAIFFIYFLLKKYWLYQRLYHSFFLRASGIPKKRYVKNKKTGHFFKNKYAFV